ncbi:MAG TPA: TonB-dependent receptor [Polyangia bacterium]|nr:TonB-dependent receptor [Polyangia bacterium]
MTRTGPLSIALAVLLLPWPAGAQAPAPAPLPAEADPAGLAPLLLEDLLDMSVSVASKADEKASAAPASITVYSDEDLKALGYYTIYDLANITPGYSGTVMYGERVLETRGQKAGSFNNNKHLVYVDEIPVNHARNYKAPIDEELPLFFARRVELLRGPASALYGTSAFFGVVNVSPKELGHEGMLTEARLSAGSRQGEWRAGGNALYSDGDRALRLTFGHYDKNASRAYVGVTDDPNNLYWDDQKSTFLNTTYTLRSSPLAGTTLGLLYLRKNGGLGESWNENGSSHELDDLTWESVIPYVKYGRVLGRTVSLRSHAMLNRGREAGVFTPDGPRRITTDGTGVLLNLYQTQVDAAEGQVEVEWNINAWGDLIGGVSADTRRARGADRSYAYKVSADPGSPFVLEPALASPSDRYTIYSAHCQLRQRLAVGSGLNLTLGARGDFGDSAVQTFTEVSPRVGLVQRLGDSLIVKAFFGTALRAPGIKEVGLNKESRETLIMANKPTTEIRRLRAETIRSVEVGPSYLGRHFLLALTLFSNRTINALDGTQSEGVQIFRNNDGDTRAQGLEAEVQVAPSRRLRFLGNYSLARARAPGDVDVEDVPTQHATLSGIFQWPAAHLTAGATARWVAGYRVTAGPDSHEPTVMADLNLVWSVLPSIDLELQLRNLLDERAKLPKHGRPDVPLPRFRALATLAVGL